MTPLNIPLVTVEGTEPVHLANQLMGLELWERHRHPVRLRLRLNHTPDLVQDPLSGPSLRLGSQVRLTLGTAGGRDDHGWAFDGAVQTLVVHRRPDTPPLLVLEARDALARLRTEPRTRVWHDVTESDLVSQVGEEHGLDTQTYAASTVHRTIHQTGVTDLELLQARATADGHDLWVRGTTLHRGPPERRSSTELHLRLGQDLLAARARAAYDGSGICGEAVTVPGLTVGSTVILTGVAPWVDGRAHRVSAARHTYDGEHGQRTHFRAGPV